MSRIFFSHSSSIEGQEDRLRLAIPLPTLIPQNKGALRSDLLKADKLSPDA